MNPQKRIANIGQKLLNPLQSKPSATIPTKMPNTFNRENFVKLMIESMNKAINATESPAKEKHVRKLLIGSHQAESGDFFWNYISIMRLKENQIVCWKFCHVLHRLIRDGHKNVVVNSFHRSQFLRECGNMWRHVEGYGQLIFKYCTLLHNRISFFSRNPSFPNDLKLTEQQLIDICENSVEYYFELSCDLFDLLEDILRLQELVLVKLDIRKLNSMTLTGQCHLAPLVACIQDSTLLYDYLVKILFRMHAQLPHDTLDGHRDRFLCHHKHLKSFYSNTNNLQYFKTLLQIPQLSEKPPNFLVSSDISAHVTPKVVMISCQDRESPEDNYAGASSSGSVASSSRTNMPMSADEMLVNFDADETDSVANNSASQLESLTSNISLANSFEVSASQNSSSTVNDDQNALSSKVSDLEAQISTLSTNLIDEKASNTALKSEISSLNTKFEEDKRQMVIEHDAKIRALEEENKKLCTEMSKLKLELKTTRKDFAKLEEELKRSLHSNEISQEAMKRMMKDLSDLKREKESNPKHVVAPQPVVAPPPPPVVEPPKQEKLNLEELLEKEMNESDRIIKEASRRIQELSEQSKSSDSGVKLEVNEKISGACTSLMQAVMNLFVKSKAMQNEIVSQSATNGKDGNGCSNFYQQNSSWTDGLVSAAKVVASAAKVLVDSSDRTMTGKGSYSELAAAAHEIAAATMQLLVASRVKSSRDSDVLKALTEAAREVNVQTGNVVATAKICAELIDKQGDHLDISSLSQHQAKKLEIESQVRILELESHLEKERVKLGLLRKNQYPTNNLQTQTTNNATKSEN